MQRPTRLPTATNAIFDTGPLISAFQSDSALLLTRLFTGLYIPQACMQELADHGWEAEMAAFEPALVTRKLNPTEDRAARAIAKEIAEQAGGDAPASSHIGEAQAITLALRLEYRSDILLLDELAARTVAKRHGLNISGFPGVLLLAVQVGMISAADLKDRLEMCRSQGTHYGKNFIEQVYYMAGEGRRLS
jgi:predicted nucleic acid-binding protein